MRAIAWSQSLKVSAAAALFVSLAWTTAPAMFDLTRNGQVNLIRDGAEELERALPPGAPIALVARTQADIETAVLMNYYFYPRGTRIYYDPVQYQADPSRPATIVHVDTANGTGPKTYAQLRNDWIGNQFITKGLDPVPVPGATFVVPLVASTDGAPPDMFTTEAALENLSPSSVDVTLQLFPTRSVARIALAPLERRRWNDLVYQLFGWSGRGWLRVDVHGAAVRARFWLVNRGRAQSVPIAYATPVNRASFDAPPGSRLWFVNVHDRKLNVKVNGQQTTVDGLSWGSVPAHGATAVEPEMPIITFVSSTARDGSMVFRWSGV